MKNRAKTSGMTLLKFAAWIAFAILLVEAWNALPYPNAPEWVIPLLAGLGKTIATWIATPNGGK